MASQSRKNIPRPTIKRLSLYLRDLEALQERGEKTVSSKRLGEALGLTDYQVRKDLAQLGQLGRSGVGYRTDELIGLLRKILGTDRRWNAAVVGAGNIGRALMPYTRFAHKGFDIVAIFDENPEVISTEVGGHRVRPMRDLRRLVRQRDISIGIVAVPAHAAQGVADRLIDAGVRGILNFAPVRLDVHDAVSVVSVDFLLSLEQLAFQVSLGLKGPLEKRTSPTAR